VTNSAYRYSPCQPCCGPTVPTNCGGCSWPSAWTVTVGGISSTSNCQTPVIQAGLSDPPGWPDSPCFHQSKDGGLDGPLFPGCEILDGTFTLASPPSPGGLIWTFQGNQGICVPGVVPLPFLQMTCNASALPNQLYGSTGGASRFSTPSGGMLLLLWTAVGIASWQQGIVGHAPQWFCTGGAYPIPFFCPFDEIRCLQPMTLTQLPYSNLSNFPLSCQGIPGSLTVTPA
jgi:hypothetical protein